MRAVVLGGGYAGLTAACTIERHGPGDLELIVIDDTGSHLIQHELHRLLRRPELSDQLTIPLESVLEEAEVLVDRVVDVDPAQGTVMLADSGSLVYDAGAICLGARTADHDIPGVESHGQPLKRIEHAGPIRDQFESVIADGGQVVIGGAGLSGIQVAGELGAKLSARDNSDKVTILLMEMADSVAPGFNADFQAAIRSALDRHGIKIRTNTRIDKATATSVRLATGEEVTADQFIWTGGLTGTDALGGTRPQIRADLSLTDCTFAAGDAVTMIDDEGSAVPPSAQSAAASGEICAQNVLAALDESKPARSRFTFDPLGWIVSVGDSAIAQVGPSVVTGSAARGLKAAAGMRYLVRAGAVREAAQVLHAHLYSPT